MSVSLPAAARANTEAGAIAFARYFVTEMDQAYVSADGTTLRPLFTASCEDCTNFLSAVSALKSAGHHQKGPSATIAGATYALLLGKPAVDVFVDYRAVGRVDSKGAEILEGKARKVAYRLRLEWRDRWYLNEIGTL